MFCKSIFSMAIVLTVAFAGSASASTITTGLVGYWGFDQGFAPTVVGAGFTEAELTASVRTLSGAVPGSAGNDPAIVANSAFGTGAVQFARSGDPTTVASATNANNRLLKIDPAGKNLLEPGSSYTYSVWYQLQTAITGTESERRYFVLEATDKGTGVTSTYAMSYGLRHIDSAQRSEVYTRVTTAPTDHFFRPSNGSPANNFGATTNTWHHVVVTYDGGTRELKAYLDGNAAGSGSFTLPTGTTTTAVPALNFGNARNGSNRPFHGLIDDFGLWNRVLNADEIAHLYTHAVPEPSLFASSALGLLLLAVRKHRRGA